MTLPLTALDVNLSQVDTSFPSLATGQHRCELKKFDCQESKKTPGLFMLIITLSTLEPASDAKGKVLEPGFEFNTRLTLPGGPKVDSEKMSGEEMEELRLKQLATFVDAACNSTQENRPPLTDQLLESLIGKQILVVMKAAKSEQIDQGYSETEVARFKPVPQG